MLRGFLPEGHRALPSAFAQQLHGTVIVSPDVLHSNRKSFRHAGAGIIEKKKEQMIAASAPGVVHDFQEGLHFTLRKKAQQRTGESFQGNGHDPLGFGRSFPVPRRRRHSEKTSAAQPGASCGF